MAIITLSAVSYSGKKGDKYSSLSLARGTCTVGGSR